MRTRISSNYKNTQFLVLVTKIRISGCVSGGAPGAAPLRQSRCFGKAKSSSSSSNEILVAWVTRPKRPKGVKGVMKQARTEPRSRGPEGPRLLVYHILGDMSPSGQTLLFIGSGTIRCSYWSLQKLQCNTSMPRKLARPTEHHWKPYSNQTLQI